jgi:(p)ppGpp synthase/HD superfamily hydrolase
LEKKEEEETLTPTSLDRKTFIQTEILKLAERRNCTGITDPVKNGFCRVIITQTFFIRKQVEKRERTLFSIWKKMVKI